MTTDLLAKKERAKIEEIKNLNPKYQGNFIRLYCTQAPDIFTLQIRTHKPIISTGSGKPRDMIASVGLTIGQLEQLLDFARAAYPDMKSRDLEPLEIVDLG